MDKYFRRPGFVWAAPFWVCAESITAGVTPWEEMGNDCDLGNLHSLCGVGRMFPYILIASERRYVPVDGVVVFERDDITTPIAVLTSTQFAVEYGKYFHYGQSVEGLWFVSEDGKTFNGSGWDTPDAAIEEYKTDGGAARYAYLGRGTRGRPCVDWEVVSSSLAVELAGNSPMTWPAMLEKRFDVEEIITQLVWDILRGNADLPGVTPIDPDSVSLTTL